MVKVCRGGKARGGTAGEAEVDVEAEAGGSVGQAGNGQASLAPTVYSTTHLESQIDELVFELYGLTEEERDVVLGG